MDILNSIGTVLFSDAGKTLKDAVIAAVKAHANLYGADLRDANLYGAKNLRPLAVAQTVIVPDGDIIGWKKCRYGVTVRLRIPQDAKRSNATGRKCRAQFVHVLEIFGGTVGISQHNQNTTYTVGEIVTCDSWNPDRWQECAGGIHFYLTREEAENQ
jgi:hypothetical protein